MNQSSCYDSIWKEILENLFEQFIQFFFPVAYGAIDWGISYEFLDKEFQLLIDEEKISSRLVDKLVKVWLKDGKEVWVLIHIEVQSHYEPDFALRMYHYNSLIFQRFHKEVASLAILTDENENWKPSSFGYNLFGCQIQFVFPVCKLVEFRKNWALLQSSDNPFAVVVMAHLKELETKKDDENRFQWKFKVTQPLYEKGFTEQEVFYLFRFIDVIMKLPKELEKQFHQTILEYEEVKKVAIRIPMDEIVMEKGLQEGLQEGLRQSVINAFEIRYGKIPVGVKESIKKITDTHFLKELHKKAIITESSDEFLRFLGESG